MAGQPRVYFDHAATTRPDPRVLQAMDETLQESWGNPSSIYLEGRQARLALDTARRQLADLLGARPNHVVITSGGSESDNTAIRGAALAGAGQGRHIITTAIEHHAVLHSVEQLEREGFSATFLPVDSAGLVDPTQLGAALRPDTILVSIIYANNEVGTIEPLKDLVNTVKVFNPRITFHTDAVQAAGYLDLDVDQLGVDMLSLSAHKFHGPRGAGVLYIRPRTPFLGQLLGGSQEKDRRAGTEDVAAAVGMATALQIATTERVQILPHVQALRDRLATVLPQKLPGVIPTGPSSPTERLANSFSCCIEGVAGEAVLIQLDLNGISASSGSACTTGSLEPSHVLTAMGFSEQLARSSLRLTLGRDNTEEEIDLLLARLPGIVEKLRGLAPALR